MSPELGRARCHEPCLLLLLFSSPYNVSFCSTIVLSLVTNPVFLLRSVFSRYLSRVIFCFASHSGAVHGSHQGSGSSCAGRRDRGIVRRHRTRHRLAAQLLGIVWASGLVYKDTVHRTFTPELFRSNASAVTFLFPRACLSSVNALLSTLASDLPAPCRLHERRAASLGRIDREECVARLPPRSARMRPCPSMHSTGVSRRES